MIETRAIETAPGLVFDVSIGGSGDAPLVLMLHGFGVSRYFWNAQVEALAAAGFLAVAPNQRGYAAGARRIRPIIPATGSIASSATRSTSWRRSGMATGAFILPDTTGEAAWPGRSPIRISSASPRSPCSRAHPQAFNNALKMPDGDQARRSQHHTTFLGPNAVPDILADDAKWLRTRWRANGVPPAAMEAHLSVIGNPPAMEAALAWYRARGVYHHAVGPTRVLARHPA